LGKSNQCSPPFLSATYGWVVVILLERTANPVYDKMNWGDRRYRVEETIRRQKEIERAERHTMRALSFSKKQKRTRWSLKILPGNSGSFFCVIHQLISKTELFAIRSDDVDLLLSVFPKSFETVIR